MVNEKTKPSDPLLEPFNLRHLQLRNRIMSTAHAPSYAEDGHPRDRYRLYHEEKAKGGLALTMMGGSTNVAPDSPSVFGQLYAGNDDVIPWFRKLTNGVKAHGAAIMCQITHMGRRTVGDDGDWLPVVAPSGIRERAHRSNPKPMEIHDIRRVVANYADAVRRCQLAGFDGVELLSHAHLLGQFMTPLINKRNDEYGGSLNNRLRLTMQVLDAVREAVGDDFVIGMRVTGDELIEGGLDAAACIEIAKHLDACGMVDFLNVLAGAPYDDLGLAVWVPPMGLPSAAHLEIAGNMRAAVSLPVFHAGGIADIATARWAVTSGLVDMVGMTRAHIADPHLVNKLAQQREEDIRPCVGLAYCVDRTNQGKDAVCGHNAATGRESRMPHLFVRDARQKKRAVVVGGGPGGMEAARVLAERGFNVVLFEATGQLGGQLLLAANGHTRRQIRGVSDWLSGQLERLKVDVRYNCYAEAAEVLAEKPDFVVIATGGLPQPLAIDGAEHARSSWDVLAGDLLSGKVLLFDERGDHQAGVTADVLATAGAEVHFVTPDRTPLIELGPPNSAVVLRDLYRNGVQFDCNEDLVAIERRGSECSALLRNTLTRETREHIADHVVVECGLTPSVDVYEALREQSRNAGAIDIAALVQGKLNLPTVNPEKEFDIVRIGDAISSRNLHAAIYDALRICSVYT